MPYADLITNFTPKIAKLLFWYHLIYKYHGVNLRFNAGSIRTVYPKRFDPFYIVIYDIT